MLNFVCALGGEAPGRWSRARPATRTLAAADDDFADLIDGMLNIFNIYLNI
jgi:hypothetical protein